MSRAKDQAILIARADLAAALHERLAFDTSVRVFSASEAGKALSTILKKQSSTIALDRKFVTSPGGAQFMTELRSAHPGSELRILCDDGGDIPLVLRRPVQTTGRETVIAGSQLLVGDVRRATRFPVRPGSEASVNGHLTALVDLSTGGAQVLSGAVLRPTQAVRVALMDESDHIMVRALIVWSMFERSKKTGDVHYRAGVQFTDAEHRLIEEYCNRHALTM
jgi:hypothetical protein